MSTIKSYTEKAKRYDKAIERAKSLLSGNQLGNAWIYKLLPELKESEGKDEKIRKALIRAFKSLNTIKVWNGIERTDILAWLEKQGEQKPTDKAEPKQEWSDYDECMLTNLIDDSNCSIDSEYVHWLESIKEKYTWKPSDEQITWLYRAADDASKDSRMKQVLNNLLSDLKKLKEG